MNYMNYFYVRCSPVATYMNIMQDKNNLSHRILIIKKCVDMWRDWILFIVTDICVINVEEN